MYHALYRKYRPQNFDSVVGQDVIVKTLRNSIENNSFSHAYMFFGPRGVGKTTVSKILSRALNCLSPINGDCCGKCKNCLIAQQKDCVDIIEMDAASNNGVDEIRELKNNAVLVPSELKYKVYIIDEVHMLSIGAFNALLKILEEPPEHVVFILATTDPQKVPETIVSRCQCFSFKRVSENSLVERMNFICKTENITIDNDVLSEIAITSEGGVRDSLGMLDKLTSYKKELITLDDFYELNDMIGKKELEKVTNSIFSRDIKSLLNSITQYNESGKNLIQVLSQIMYYLSDRLVDYYMNNSKIEYDISDVQDLITVINEKMFDIKRSGNPKISVEILFINFINSTKKNEKIISREIILEPEKTKVSVKEDKKISEQRIENKENFINAFNEDLDIDATYKNKKIRNINEIMKIRVNNTLAMANKEILKKELQLFESLREYSFDQQIGYIVCNLLDGKLRAASVENIIISFEYDSIVSQNLEIIDKIIEVYNKLTNSNKKIAIISDKCWEEEKKKYIDLIKSGAHYSVIEEPEELFEETKKDVIIQNEAIELFGKIVEFE